MTKVKLFFQTKSLKLQDMFEVIIYHDVAKSKQFDISYQKFFIVRTISQYRFIGKYVKSKYTESFLTLFEVAEFGIHNIMNVVKANKKRKWKNCENVICICLCKQFCGYFYAAFEKCFYFPLADYKGSHLFL